MKSITKITITFLLVLSSLAAHAEVVTIYEDEGYPPLAYMSNGKPSGIVVKLFERISKDTGDTYKFEMMPWKRAVVNAEEGTGGITSFTYTVERAEKFDYSDSYYDDKVQVVTLKTKKFKYANPNDLHGKLGGGLSGASYGDLVDKFIATGVISLDRDQNQSLRLKKLLAGRIDYALIGSGDAGLNFIIASDSDLSENKSRLTALTVPLTNDKLHLAFAKTSRKTGVIARFNAALAKLKKSGEYYQIINP